MYDIIGYLVSASILYVMFSLIFKVGDCLANKIENIFDFLKAKNKKIGNSIDLSEISMEKKVTMRWEYW